MTPMTHDQIENRTLELTRICFFIAICLMTGVLAADYLAGTPTWTTVLDAALLGSAAIAALDVSIHIKLSKTLQSQARMIELLTIENNDLLRERARRIEMENSLFS